MLPEDFDVPEFMRPKTILCEEEGCANRVLAGRKKCLDCEVQADLPKVLDGIEDILLAEK